MYPKEPVPSTSSPPGEIQFIPPAKKPVPLDVMSPLHEIYPNELVLNVSASNPALALTLLALISPLVESNPTIRAPETDNVSVVLLYKSPASAPKLPPSLNCNCVSEPAAVVPPATKLAVTFSRCLPSPEN